MSGYFRGNVGILLINKKGLVLAAERSEIPGAWQLPQGGIDQGEGVEQAALRELREELGFDNQDVKNLLQSLGTHPGWLAYELPEENWSEKNGRGQAQKFFAYRFVGGDDQLDAKFSASKEFRSWKWVNMSDLIEKVWAVRRPVYEALAQAFSAYLAGKEMAIDEANLIWDEYKYRHDLIWKHLIRSTTAVVALLTVPFLKNLDVDAFLIAAAFFIAIGYAAFTRWILDSELNLFEQVKERHRKRQRNLFGLHLDEQDSKFPLRVRIYGALLIILSIAAAIMHYFFKAMDL